MDKNLEMGARAGPKVDEKCEKRDLERTESSKNGT